MADERPSIPLRNLTSTVITGADATAFAAAMSAFLDAAGDDQMLVKMVRIADREVLVLYTE